MKKIRHSIGWHTVKELTDKIKAQRIAIAVLIILLILSVLFGPLRGR